MMKYGHSISATFEYLNYRLNKLISYVIYTQLKSVCAASQVHMSIPFAQQLIDTRVR